MRIQSKLCHVSENKAVVLVNGWINEKNVGTALAEGPTVELAEDKAISRLNKRLNIVNNNITSIDQKNNNIIKEESKVSLPINEKLDNVNLNQDPTDWSNELASIDSEIKRLNWSRVDEINFLDKNLGYNNRNKITKYDELIKYLSMLKKLNNDPLSKYKSTDLKSLIKESDIILEDLSWDLKQGREYLQREFNVSSRSELDVQQLISFVSKLKSIRNQYSSQ